MIDLLDQIYGLLAGEKMERREFADILDSGLTEISVGTIPQNVDRVLVGDIERTRLKQVKVLFFLGVNDGNIPKGPQTAGSFRISTGNFCGNRRWSLRRLPGSRCIFSGCICI